MDNNTPQENGEPLSIDELDFEKQAGMLPVITQDVETREVLMLAYANREAVSKTQETGFAHYWSRSRNSLWKKGESSGHLQKIETVFFDCDSDTLLYLVHQSGPACHTGRPTCFYKKLELQSN